ncbi:hypothetical protein LAZ67_1008015 [Cordylochernes scorpioides]|uniref:HTH CENPB-type domain-containing protein n=1 Tax=Cordylochernes scorpioides TaxID=51811 RepID=A0ABY6K1G6_9ARAC|nr:hypothetical protein LAZ67_1008015 [Cordylochernes scorpioides]
MDRKKVCKKSSAKKKIMSIELKREIIEKHEQGVRVVDLSRQYDRSTSMICSVLKRKESIKSVTPAKGLTIISKLRTSLHENMEKLLMVWVTEKQLQGDTLTQTIICEKARAIYGDLLKQTPQTSIDEASKESFKASRGWFENFKKRSGIHSVVRHGEAASSDMKAAEDYIKTFSDLIKAQGYISQQVFNCDETGLFWKKMPNRTYITAEEKMMPGHKPMKDRLTLALCANASGDCKIKPLLVYHSENPRAFKSHKILKEKLQVMWRSNPKAWVTRKFFVEWVNLVFGPTVKKYLQENNLPVQALLILDNAPANPPNLEDDILEELKFIKVLYLPPNTTPILQPMDQQMISNFKKLYTKHLFRRCFEVTESTNLTLREFWKDHFNIAICLQIIDQAWLGVTTRTLTSAWKKLWPEAVAERIYEELEPGVSVEEEIVSLGKSMGLEVEERDVNELIEEHTQELTTEEIQELQSQQHTEVMQVIGFMESEEEVISTKGDPMSLAQLETLVSRLENVALRLENNVPSSKGISPTPHKSPTMEPDILTPTVMKYDAIMNGELAVYRQLSATVGMEVKTQVGGASPLLPPVLTLAARPTWSLRPSKHRDSSLSLPPSLANLTREVSSHGGSTVQVWHPSIGYSTAYGCGRKGETIALSLAKEKPQ